MIIRTVTLGCKVNQCESADIVSALQRLNHNASEGLEPADVYILNTCSVTAEADKKSRQYISKMQKLNPQCSIIVVGCSSQNSTEKFNRPNVIAVGGTHGKTDFVLSAINQNFTDNGESTISDRVLYCENDVRISQNSTKTRDFIKIQDGCDRFCNYCIIPYLRGRCKSEPVQKIIESIKRSKSKEIVLTGIDMSSYGKDTGSSLTELLRTLSRFKDVRKRLGSLECEVVSEELLTVMIDGNYCPHFHLSLQSGNDEVLKSMNRRYTTALYMEKVELIRKFFPLAAITTDVIVGYPTESDEYFDSSVQFMENCRFADIHVFPYSNRAGTLASKKYRTLDPEIVSQRVERLLTVKRRAKSDFAENNIGTVAEVYTEEPSGNYNVGYSTNYLKVYSHSPCGMISQLILTEPYLDGIIGIAPEQ
ncbi:MAG: tRNA (N(6)-L-threonylcarbamoyladenosine(37)-C(2))-methylthiotransferase MtaB [Clostridiales bacterium]|nr:tRNA (N(6)-L-threonylcarbamoyladenosine(37)-C(2))-methylthiotransferase MtaB [Clostridiales bacterium]